MGNSFDLVAFTQVSAERPLYERDIMNMLCLPDGARMSLSYRKKWVDDTTWRRCQVRQQQSRWINVLRRQSSQSLRLLLVLHEPDASPNRRFLPLRFAELQSVEIHEYLSSGEASQDDVEPGVTLCIALCERPSERLTNELVDVLSSCHAVREDQTLSHYLRFIMNPTESLRPYQDFLRKPLPWQRHLGLVIHRARSLDENRHWAVFGPFKQVRGLFAGRSIYPSRKRELRATTLKLKGGTSYEIDCHVLERSMKEFSETPVSAAVVGAHVEVSPAGVSQHGSGALVNFLVTTQRKFSPELVGIDFQILAKGADKKMERAQRGKAPEFHMRLEIGPPLGYWLLTFSLLLLSAVLLNFSAETIADVVRATTGDTVTKLPPYYATIALCAKALGGTLVAITSIYALRKMPVGK